MAPLDRDEERERLLDLVRRTEALLTRQRWLPDPIVGPEGELLRDCRDALAEAAAAST